jgi:tRNA modification GTPase
MFQQATKGEPIAAIATPAGEGAIAVIRISGEGSLDIAKRIFSGPVDTFKSHTAHFGHILDADGNSIDSVLLLVMRRPRSYTGEDTVEISCHGGAAITRRVLHRVLEAGARPAEPGEFSLRAFLNGKIDLAQAEAVQQLIGAKNDLALTAAAHQLEGILSQAIGTFQKRLTDQAAILEAWVDFPEEDLEFIPFAEFIHNLESLKAEMEKLASTFNNGKALADGLTLCLAGCPNVGKSSLMNALLGKERAIVTEIPGTTRDVLEEELRLGPYHFRLLDTAGVRETTERIEQEGIRRTRVAIERADLTLLLLDASRPLQPGDEELLSLIPPDKRLIVWNKTDLAPPHSSIPGVAISAGKRQGLDALKQAIDAFFALQVPDKQQILLTKERHFFALQQAIEALDRALANLRSHASPEFSSADLRQALNHLGEIIGTNVTEDVLSAIFSQFCLGK